MTEPVRPEHDAAHRDVAGLDEATDLRPTEVDRLHPDEVVETTAPVATGETPTVEAAPTDRPPSDAAALDPATVQPETVGAAAVELETVADPGVTTIAEQVVEKLATLACREVPGVHGMGNAVRRAISSLTERIPGAQFNVAGGVSVEKGQRQAAIDLSIVAEYGYPILELSRAVRRNVISVVEHGTGLDVIEVNVHVTDIHIPGDDRAGDLVPSRVE